jgi:predicted RNase H-like HicB family nuclease
VTRLRSEEARFCGIRRWAVVGLLEKGLARSRRVMEIDFTTQVWKEGNTYVSYAKELDVSSCGKTIQEAKKNLVEAVECFLEAAE